jgi:hypothetical protein
MKSALVMAVTLLGGPLAANSASPNGNEPTVASAIQAETPSMSVHGLYEECIAVDNQSQMFCAGYFNASMDSMILLGADPDSQAFGICPKTPITAGAALQAFKNWAQRHPETWGYRRNIGVIWALQELWACK